jgi:hypothetical protein
MIKLLDILNELNIQNKKSLGSGEQQIAYPYLKDPNYVIKTFNTGELAYNKDPHVLNRYEIKHYLKMLEKHPEYIANVIIPKENSKYYFQEKVNIEKAQNDIWNLVIEIIKKMALDLENKYKTPHDAYEDLNIGAEIFLNANSWEDIKNINNINDLFAINYDDGIPMNYLFDDYIYKKYSKNIPLVQKLKPVWDVGTNQTQYGLFHEDNLGYDRNGNFKIIDL